MTDDNPGRKFECIKVARLGPYTVRLYDLQAYDRRGQTALGYRIAQGRTVLAVCSDPKGAVYGSPLHADDSNATLYAAISLITHEHPASWAEELAELAEMKYGEV